MKAITLLLILFFNCQIVFAQTMGKADVVMSPYDKDSQSFIFSVDGKEIARQDATTQKVSGTIPDGPVKSFIDGGKIKYVWVMEYKNNEAIYDSLKIYDEQGNTPEGLFIKDGKLNGTYRTYHPNGKVRTEVVYENGLEKETSTFSEEGQKVLQFTYNRSENWYMTRAYYPNGSLKLESKYNGLEFDPNKLVYKNEYDESGNLIKQ